MSYSAHGVSVRIGAATLLADVSLDVRAGELVAVAGPNGAGKSTLIAALAGDRRVSAGVVRLEGRPLGDWPRAELARSRAVMGSGRDVAFDYTVEEVALLGRLPIHGGDPGTTDREIVRWLLGAVDCLGLADRPFATLSSGERQRVGLARAIAQVVDGPPGAGTATDAASRYLLLDEPTSSLDPAHQHVAMRLLCEQTRAGRGVLAVLHDLNLAAAYADRLVLLASGRVVAAGPVPDVLRSEILEASFGIPMLVVPHPHLPHPIVIADPHQDVA
jgi:iron complex transport system ATP-binding protein